MGEHEPILLAEASDTVRKQIRTFLEKEGHTVVANTGSLEEAKQFVDNPDLVFRLAIISGYLPNPGMGEQAAAYIRQRRPDVVIISFSGNPQTYGDFNIQKPVPSRTILDAVQNA